MLEQAMFDVFALAAVLCAAATVTRRNPIHAALWLLGAFVSMAVLFLLLRAPFLAAMHVLVYTGAILVLFLFVIMLLNLQPEDLAFDPHPQGRKARVVAALLALAAAGLVVATFIGSPREFPEAPDRFGSLDEIGRVIFDAYVLPFELVAVLILAATVGALVLGRPERKS
jgi:NADH-quinone oxidoreductase subunit J